MDLDPCDSCVGADVPSDVLDFDTVDTHLMPDLFARCQECDHEAHGFLATQTCENLLYTLQTSRDNLRC